MLIWGFLTMAVGLRDAQAWPLLIFREKFSRRWSMIWVKLSEWGALHRRIWAWSREHSHVSGSSRFQSVQRIGVSAKAIESTLRNSIHRPIRRDGKNTGQVRCGTIRKDSQINIIQICLFETRIDRFFCLVISHGPWWHFRGEKDLGAWYTGFSYSLGTRLFIAVDSRWICETLSNYGSSIDKRREAYLHGGSQSWKHVMWHLQPHRRGWNHQISTSICWRLESLRLVNLAKLTLALAPSIE